MASHGGRETEIKLAAPDAAAGRDILRRAGFHISRRKVFESNTVFDTPRRTLRAAGSLLRVRTAGRVVTLTYKGPSAAGSRHKSREELEVELSDAHAAAAIVERLGFEPVFRYEKYRTEYCQTAGRGMAMLDETPVGVYLELEGPARWIDRTARQLGCAESEYITASYAALYLGWCRLHGVAPGHMLFARSQVGQALSSATPLPGR
jgi:adenylate cyclase class 2